jgi:hypothetical protein
MKNDLLLSDKQMCLGGSLTEFACQDLLIEIIPPGEFPDYYKTIDGQE